jgi:hypothetical protein
MARYLLDLAIGDGIRVLAAQAPSMTEVQRARLARSYAWIGPEAAPGNRLTNTGVGTISAESEPSMIDR